MKTVYSLIAVILLYSCATFPVISFNADNSLSFNINKSSLTYEGAKLLDPTTNSEFNEKKGKLNDIIVERITYTISNFTGPATQTASATFTIADGNGGGSKTIASYSNVNLSSLNGVETDFIIDPAAAATLGTYLLEEPNKAMVAYTGSVNEAPVQFDLKVTFYYKAKSRLIGTNL